MKPRWFEWLATPRSGMAAVPAKLRERKLRAIASITMAH
jgi:hypothetical protein